MREEFILDHRLASRWISGKPEASVLGDTKAKGREQRHVESYRCVGCGYLESYASAEVS